MITQTFLALALGLTLTAQDGGPGPHSGRRPQMAHGRGFGPMAMRGLDLTDAQKASMKVLADKHREAMKPKLEAAAQARKALHGAMMDPATSVDQLKALHDKASQAQFEMALGRRAMMQESMALLTSEQKAKADKFRAEHPGGFDPGSRPGRGHGKGMKPQGPPPETK